jgi:hypothetical protein
MLKLAYDPELHVLVVGISGPQSSADHEKVLGAVDTLDRNGRDKARKVGLILLLGADTQPPNAHWRRRYAEQRKAFKASAVYTSVVTQSAILRGVMTAMNWISPDPPHVKSVHHATFREAATWVEQMQGTSVANLRRLHDEADPGGARAGESAGRIAAK